MSTDDEVLREVTSIVRDLGNGLVTLEQSSDDETIAELFRASHTLKSNCAMEGIDGAATLAHAVEDFLAAVRSDDVIPSWTLVDGALDAVDDTEAILNAVERGEEPTVDPDATAAALRDLIEEQHETENGTTSTEGDGTEKSESDIDLILPEPDEDLSAEEALERVSIFDDLDKLAANIDDDDEAFGELEGAGRFDTIGESKAPSSRLDEPDTPSTVETSTPDASEKTPTDSRAASTDDSVDPGDRPFEWVKAETSEETDIEALEADLEDVTFGEFDDEDEMSIQELIELDPEEEFDTPATTENDAAQTPTSDASRDRQPDGETHPGNDTTDSTDDTDSAAYIEEPEDDPFIWVKDETSEETDIDALETDLEDVTFGEFDDEDEMSIQELIELTPETPETAEESTTLDEPTSDVSRDRQPDGETRPVNDTTDSTDDTDSAAYIEEPEDDPFIWVKDETSEETDIDALETDLEDVTFGEFDDDILDAIEAIDLEQSESPTEIEDVEFESETGTKEFTERFGGLFDVESDGEGPIRSVGTIEDSTLDTEQFRRDPSMETDPAETPLHSISVDVETADDLLNLVEELSMARLSFEDAIGDTISEETSDVLGALQSIEAAFRRSVIDLRLMPLSSSVDGLPRVARDIARDQGKRISFDIEGEDVKLDRSVAERIGEPLVHLVRNAADHGIESPDERKSAGKPAEGQIELRAERVRDGAVIEVTDDGRGIDPDAVLTKGVEDGVITQAEAETLDEEDAYDLLFHHGLSTSEEITSVSGRGVGMDIVSRVCSDLDGTVEVESEPGEGTTVRLRLPVTVAMAKLLFVEASDEKYAIPMSDVRYIGEPEEQNTIDDRTFVSEPALDWDETNDEDESTNGDKDNDEQEQEQYRLVRLHEAFDVPARSTGDGTVIWLRPEIGRVAIHCDGVLESREAVVKPYGPPLDHVPGISGATMGESGDVINIIDVTTIA
ncbi:chemotaxis protein CheA [Halocatena marina]|uniref:chemotaxis protein CheA n=1 Tax=Halocatena marina TaxID=2934937 RepID=UPI00200FFEB2|nr:ATP-binding protein [Halocatena marina]